MAVFIAPREYHLLESSMIDMGGSGQFDTRAQNPDEFEWSAEWDTQDSE